MSQEEQATEKLLATANALADQVRGLADHLVVVERLVNRGKILTWFSIGLAVLAAVGAFTTVSLYSQVHDTARSNQKNAVIACRNANDQRAANKILWTTLFAAVQAQNADQSAERSALIEKFLGWIGDLYAPRDCSDLSKTYEIPAPPRLTSSK